MQKTLQNRISRRSFGAALAGGTLAVATGCGGGPEHVSTEHYYLVVAHKTLPYWQAAKQGLVAAARTLKVPADMVGPDEYSPQAEVDEFKAAVAKNPAGILVSAANPQLMKPEIDAAVGKGIRVVTIDSDVPDSQRLCFIGTDNYDVGKMGAEQALKVLNGKGNLVVYTMPEQANLADRLRGYRDGFASSPGIKLEVIDVKGDPRIVFDTTKEILEKRASQVDGFLCLVSLAAPEVVQQLDRQNVKGKLVIGMDTAEGTLNGIKKGVISATIAQKPYTMAYQGIRLLADLTLFGPADVKSAQTSKVDAQIPAFIDTGVVLVDKNNVDQVSALMKA